VIHHTLENHLEELCPSCGKNHDTKWDMHFDYMNCYISGVCNHCNYSIFKKTDFMSCGKLNYADL